MTIDLITSEQYETLKKIQETHKVLTLQNNGYETITDPLTKEDKEAIEVIDGILRKSVLGFVEFTNFRMANNDEVVVRLQYNYNAEDNSRYFTGVGYILMKELFTGFINTRHEKSH